MDSEEFVEAVLGLVESVPRSRVTTYGAIADAIGHHGPRRVGNVLATWGGPVPWWRVVRSDGTLPPSHGRRARAAYAQEGTPLRRNGAVDLALAFWTPVWPTCEEPPDSPPCPRDPGSTT